MTTGFVVIGRNEGERLRVCLESIRARGGEGTIVVYADSGSGDGSPELARSMGVEVVELDPSKPFSAARGRNEGLARLRELAPGVEFVQFIDGDCELSAGWMEAGVRKLESDEKIAIVCGRVRERHRDASVYNRLCDMEFNRKPGNVAACGGIFLARRRAMDEVGGFDPRVVAGEEPEMCLRLRRAGYAVWRLADDMCLHDSAMMRFGQWWKRSVRSGYAYAIAKAMHGGSAERHGVKESRSIWAWSIVPIVLALAAAWPTWGLSLALLLVYPLQALRIAKGRKLPGETFSDRVLFGVACMAAKWPQLVGQIRFHMQRRQGRAATIIEHREPGTGGAAGNVSHS